MSFCLLRHVPAHILSVGDTDKTNSHARIQTAASEISLLFRMVQSGL